MIRNRGSVALRPAFLRSCDVDMVTGGCRVERGRAGTERVPAYDIVSDRLLAASNATMRMVLCAIGFTLMLGGCAYLSSLGVYKLDIDRGNSITQDQVGRLTVGQTREQVSIALGTQR